MFEVTEPTPLGQVGPFALVKELSRGPGLLLVEGRSESDERVLLQIVRFRRADEGEETAARQEAERLMAQGTVEEVSRGFPCAAHGAVDLPDGTRLIYWRLLWPTAPFPVDEARALSETELLDIASALAKRIGERHQRELGDPLLSEAVLAFGADATEVEVLGVPVRPSARWVTLDLSPPRRAPEESDSEPPAPSGDLWRLGQTLRALSRRVPELGEGTWQLVELLSSFDPSGRPASAEEVLERIAFLRAAPADLAGETGLADASDLPDASDLVTLEPAEVVEIEDQASPRRASSWADAVEEEEGTAPEPSMVPDLAEDLELRPTTEEAPAAATPESRAPLPSILDTVPTVPPPSKRRDELPTPPRRAEAEAPSVPPPLPSWTDTDRATASVTERTRAISPQDDIEVPMDPADVRTQVDQRAEGKVEEDKILNAHTAAWAPPVYAQGASPWSEVLSTQSAHHRERRNFDGYAETLPAVVEKDLRPGSLGRGLPIPERSSIPTPTTSGINPSRVVVGVGAVLLVLGVVTALLRPSHEPVAALGTVVAAQGNQTTLASTPEGASVISERDGEILGRTPLSFLIPSGEETVVLVVLRGHEPQRVVLPDRGALRAELAALSPEAECELLLELPKGLEVEPIEAALGGSSQLKLQGAAVIRAKPGQSRVGARLLRCPELGGERRYRLDFSPVTPPATILVSHPPGGRAYVDGEPVGEVPVSAPARRAFTEVQILDPGGASTTRWVPSHRDVEVQMPAVVARDLMVVSGEDREQEAEGESGQEDYDEDEEDEEPEERPKVRVSESKKARARNLLRSGNRLLLSGRTDRARKTFLSCLKVDPSAAGCHRALATLYRREGDSANAKAHFLKYLELAPDSPDGPTIRRILRTLP